MSHNDSWMPLYIGDYLGDTMELDGAQHGAYLLLLMYYWRNGPLPLDDARLAQIARTDPKVWRKTIGPAVRPFFHEQDGKLHQKRCDLELAKAAAVSSKRRAAADARWNGHTEPPPSGTKADANASANASQMDMQTACTHAGASLSQSQLQKEPPVGPHGVGTGAPPAGTPPRRADGTNLRAAGSNPRATGTNPRETNTNPRANGTNPRRNSRNGFHDLAREMDAEEGLIVIDGTAEVADLSAFRLQAKAVGHG